MPGYDIIGDIHGYNSLLKKLLKQLGYSRVNGTWKHPERQAIFVGDYINRGPEIKETIETVRSMVEAGHARAILGNHEYALILYHIKDNQGVYLAHHIAANRSLIQTTLNSFAGDKESLKEHLRWLRTLPFFLDLGSLRVAHAYWNNDDVRFLQNFLPSDRLPKSLLRSIHEESHPASAMIYRLIKGLEFQCPDDLLIRCSKGISRKVFKMNWWESPKEKTFRELSFGNKFVLPNYQVPRELLPQFDPYPVTEPMVVIGHYCLWEGASVLQENICCVDSCVSSTGQLSAYRYSGELKFDRQNIVTVASR